MVVTVTHDGYIKRLPPSTYRAQNRGGRGISATNTREGDFLEYMFVALTHDYILFFTDHGKVYWIKVYDLPDGDANGRRPGDREPLAARRRREDHGAGPRPRVPRRRMPDDGHPPRDRQEDRADRRSSDHSAEGSSRLGLDEGDQLIGVARTKAGDQVVLSTKEGMAIRFDESDVRSMGRPAYGVKGINLVGGRRGRRDGRRQRRRRPREPLDRLRQRLRQTHRTHRIPLAKPRRQGAHRHQDDRPQRPGRRDRQGDRHRRGDAHDDRRHPDPHQGRPTCG